MKKRLISISLSVLLVVGCTHFEEPLLIKEAENEATTQTRSGGVATFERMANPYKLEVMQEVYDSFSVNPIDLEPTHLYVRFLPQDNTQMRQLHELGLEL